MRAILKLELIADDFFYHQRKGLFHADFDKWLRYAKRLGPNKKPTWVAKITGFCDQFGLKREFIQGQRDYSQANSTGSRGIYCYYALKPGIYEINERVSWKRVRRYFIRVQDAQIEEIDRSEVENCLVNGI